MEIIMLWLLSGFIGAIGSGKNRAGSGFILGMLLGPIGWHITLTAKGDRKDCPMCRSKIHKKAIDCPNCRSVTANPSPAAIALVIMVLLTTTAGAFDEPQDFKGVKFGASREEAKAIIQRQWAERGEKTLGHWWKIHEQVSSQSRTSTVFFWDHIGAAKVVETKMHFIDDRFSAVELKFGTGYFSVLEGAFVDRYGPPDSSQESEISNRAGAKFTNKTSTWKGKTLTAMITKYFGTITDGWALIATPEFDKIREQELQQKTRDTAKDL